MEMIQNAMMFQDAAPVALPQAGRGTISAPRPADGGSSFAELLGRQPSRDEASAPTDPQGGDATPSSSGKVATLRLQNSFGAPASATGDAQDSQQAASTNLGGTQTGLTAPKGNAGNALQSLKWHNGQFVVSDTATKQTTADGAGNSGATPDTAKLADRLQMLNDLRRASLAADTQGTAALTDVQQGKGVSAATSGDAKKLTTPAPKGSSGREKEASQPVRKSLAAEAQGIATSTATAQQGLAGMLLATAKDTGVFQMPLEAVAGKAGQDGRQMATPVGGAIQLPTDSAVVGSAGPAPTGGAATPATGALTALTGAAQDAAVTMAAVTKEAVVPNESLLTQAAAKDAVSKEAVLPKEVLSKLASKDAVSNRTVPAETVSSVSFSVPSKDGALFANDQNIKQGSNPAAKPAPVMATAQKAPTPAAGNAHSLKEVPLTATTAASGGSERLTVVPQGSGMDSSALDAMRAAAPGTLPEGPQTAAKGGAAQPVTTAAPEKEQPVAAASDAKAGPAAPAPNGVLGQEQQQTPVPAASADGSALPDRFAQGTADSKAHAAMGFHGTYAAARGVTEQGGTKQEAPVEEAGIKTAPTAGAVKFAPFQGSAGQDGFGDTDKKGHPEQKAQVDAGASVQPQGVGLSAAVAAEAPLPEAKPVDLKSALHQSILAQIKDGVVTHDDKGNGQMSIRLNPGELGELKIQVRMDENSNLRVEVQADNKTVKDLLMGNLDSLKDSLTAKNFTMDGFNVSTGGGGFNSPLPEQKESPRQQSSSRLARAGSYSDQGEQVKVNYLTGEVNNLLDVRF